MGFCLFNNVAVAARHARDAHGVERVLVFDWDVHHGNGTNDIFHATDEVLFVSAHESPLYPGTGPASDVGSGAGEGYTVNIPVPAGSGDETWCSLAEHVVVAAGAQLRARARPRLRRLRRARGRSAGRLRGHRRRVRRDGRVDVAAPAPSSACRSGSCSRAATTLQALARSLVDVLEVLGSPSPPAGGELPVHPLASAALERLSSRWPALV